MKSAFVPVVALALGVCQFMPVFIGLEQSTIHAQNQSEIEPIRDKWAVVIGIDRFSDKRIPPLRYSVKDAQDFAKFLVEKENFAPDHIKLLLNEEASSDQILDTIGDNWLPRRVLPEDLVLIYASTHGSPKEVDVAGENFLVASDTKVDRLFSSAIKLEDLAAAIKRRTGCKRIVLVLDACNSGAAAATGGKGMVRAQNFDVETIVGEGVIVLSSSSADQRSWESVRYQNGVFTRRLIEALQAKGTATGIEDAFKVLCESVEQEVKYDRKTFQTPVFRSKWKGPELVLAVMPARPRKVEEPPPSLQEESVTDISNSAASNSATPVVQSPERNVAAAQSTTSSPRTTNLAATVTRTALPGRVAIVTVTPPNVYDLTKSNDYPKEFSDADRETIKHLPQWIHKGLWTSLNAKLGDRMVSVEDAASSLNGFVAPSDASSRQAIIQMGRRLNARYILIPMIASFSFTARVKWSNEYKIQALTYVCDAQTGQTIATIVRKYSKTPWLGDSAMWFTDYCDQKVVPDFCEKLASDVVKKIP